MQSVLMKRSVPCLRLAAATACLLLPDLAARAADGWWNKAWDFRIPLVMTEKQGVARTHEPVVIPGLRVIQAIGTRGIRLSSLRLIADGRELPLQIDEKDMTGGFLFQYAGNDLLDDDDEIVFTVTLKPSESRRLYLYGDTTNTVRRALFDAGSLAIRQNLDANSNHDMLLSNQRVTVGIRSGRNSTVCGGLGRGAVTLFQMDGSDRVTQGHSWGWFLFGSPLQELPWGEPVPVARGPVRAIVAMKAIGVDQKIGGKAVHGDVCRHFILYDDLPLLVVREKLPPKFADAPLPLTYTVPLQPSGLPRDWVRERLYVPDAQGKVGVFDYRSDMAPLPAAGPGWFALQNPQSRTGLAVLLPAGLTKGGQAHLCGLGKVQVAEVMKSAWGANNAAVEAQFTVEPNGVTGADYAYAILGLDGETPNELGRRLPALWKTPLGSDMEIRPLEVQP